MDIVLFSIIYGVDIVCCLSIIWDYLCSREKAQRCHYYYRKRDEVIQDATRRAI